MNFSEFKRLLGAEPRSRDPEFLRARQSSPEFEEVAAEAERLEKNLERAVSIPAPEGLEDSLMSITRMPVDAANEKSWWPMALAASVLVAVGAAGLIWKMNPGWDSVEEYVAYHYSHDGEKLLSRTDGASAYEIQTILSELNVSATPALTDIVGLIKYCPTPGGKGIHMILNTKTGPVTVFYMPDTEVTDREMLTFNDMEAILVDLQSGSAAIIGPNAQLVSGLYDFVQDSILPAPGNS